MPGRSARSRELIDIASHLTTIAAEARILARRQTQLRVALRVRQSIKCFSVLILVSVVDNGEPYSLGEKTGICIGPRQLVRQKRSVRSLIDPRGLVFQQLCRP